MNGTVETIVAAGDEMDVFYKCPHCCAGEKQIVIRLQGDGRSQFVHAMLSDGGIRVDSGSCGREILLPPDDYVIKSLKMSQEVDEAAHAEQKDDNGTHRPSGAPSPPRKKRWWRFW